MAEYVTKVLYIVEVVLGFGGLIFIHELGHFLAAKANGVKVLKFAIGFDFWGIRLLKKTIGDTEYVIGAFPLGGYVKMLGQEDLPEDGEDEEPQQLPEGHFLSKGVWARTQIISAGVIANFLLAFVLCYGAYQAGYHRYLPEIGSVGFDSLQAGLRPGDVILSIGGDEVESWTEMFMAYAMQEPGADVDVVVRRGAERVTLQLPVLRDPSEPINVPDFERAIGLQIAGIVKDSPAERGGIDAGDTLVALDGTPLESWSHFSSLVSRRPGEVVRIELERLSDGDEPGAREVLELTLDESDDLYAPTRTLGLAPGEPATIDAVLEGSPAAAAGLKAGDRIVAVGGTPVERWRDAWLAIEFAPAGEPLPLTIRRGQTALAVDVVPVAVQHWAIGMWGLPVIGAVHRAPDEVVVGHVVPGGPAAAAGMQAGDRLTKIVLPAEDGEEPEYEIYNWNYLFAGVADVEPGSWVRLEFERDGLPMTKSLEVAEDPTGKRRGMVGVFGSLKQERVSMGPIEAIGPSLKKPFLMFDEFAKGIHAMIVGRVSPKTVSGPVGIVSVVYSAAEQGVGDLLLLLALISVNLAVVNFLPIPITDGGHFCFLMYEKIRGRRMSDAVQGKFMWAGLVFLLGVFVLVTWNDVMRIFFGR